jgi:hypothetical protein
MQGRRPGDRSPSFFHRADLRAIDVALTLRHVHPDRMDEAARTAADTSGFLREQIGKLAPMFLAAPTRELLDVGACS